MSLREDRDRFAAAHPETVWTREGRRWGVIRAGETGPWLVLLPGTLGRADVFWQVIEPLSDRARILSLSYPDAGGMEDWAADVAAAAQAHGASDAVILGSSLGGWVAQVAASRRPDVFATLVAANTLCDASILAAIPTYAQDLYALPDAELPEGFAAGLRALRDAEPRFAELAGLLLSEAEGRIPAAELRRRLIVLKEAPPLPVPPAGAVFTVESDDDHLVTPPVRAAVRERLTPARAFRFAWGTHFPYVTRPAEYLALIEEALGLDPSGLAWPEGAETSL
ncbi:MAG: alpha/beta hydrolase [Pseudomonadota bacterium]